MATGLGTSPASLLLMRRLDRFFESASRAVQAHLIRSLLAIEFLTVLVATFYLRADIMVPLFPLIAALWLLLVVVLVAAGTNAIAAAQTMDLLTGPTARREIINQKMRGVWRVGFLLVCSRQGFAL